MTFSNTMIQRNRLIELADSISDSRILYLQAPAGYGKSVFAKQWLEDKKVSNAMITLDQYDNSAEDICYKLKNMLEDLCLQEEREEVYAFIKHPDFNKAPVDFLMRAVTAMKRTEARRIVIDDLHYITVPALQIILADFLERLPSAVKICILSRGALPDTFSNLILKNGISVLPKEQLLFNGQEIYLLYKNKGLSVTKKQAEEVLRFTDGWPIGINALLLSGQIPSDVMPKDCLESFLKTQVWEKWNDSYKEFMIATCLEEELTAEICDALTEKKDSKTILEQLLAQGAFLIRQHEESYRFHKLFQEFLQKQFLKKPEAYRRGKIRASGNWYMERGDFFHAVRRFASVRDYEQMACCFDMLEKMDRTGFDTEQVMHVIHDTLDKEMLERYPFLYFMMAFTARNEGRLDDFKEYADQYYRHYPQITERNPELGHNIFFLYIMDFRLTMDEILKMAASVPAAGYFQGVRGSATIYFPFFHRSFRDFSELLPGDIQQRMELLGNSLGQLLGNEYGMLAACIRGGLYYEKGDLQRAEAQALLAASELKDDFAPESKFCALLLMLSVAHALRNQEQERLIQTNIEKMMEEDKAYYLQYNFEAVVSKNRMHEGKTDAAEAWCKTWGKEVPAQLDFFHLYGHFTSARAYILLDKYNNAIVILEKILDMCTVMKRPLDVIEAEILLAISYWNMKRRNRDKALDYLTKAIETAQVYGYEQAFIYDGGDLKNMLAVLKNWTMRSDYQGNLSSEVVRRLYVGALEQAKYNSGLIKDKAEREIKLTRRQKSVAQLMCEGYSYRKIAEELGIQFSTVRTHIEMIYRKLDVSSMDEAILKLRGLHMEE